MMDSGSPPLAGFYFILLVFIGAYFLMNILLVVIISNYSQTKETQQQEAQQKKDELKRLEEEKVQEEKLKMDEKIALEKGDGAASILKQSPTTNNKRE